MTLNLPPHIESNQSITIPAIAPKASPLKVGVSAPQPEPPIQQYKQHIQPQPQTYQSVPSQPTYNPENTTIPFKSPEPQQKPASPIQQNNPIPESIQDANNTYNLNGANAQIHIHQGTTNTSEQSNFSPLAAILNATDLTELADLKTQLEYALYVADAKKITLEAQEQLNISKG